MGRISLDMDSDLQIFYNSDLYKQRCREQDDKLREDPHYVFLSHFPFLLLI
jgi:hypothetical protein